MMMTMPKSLNAGADSPASSPFFVDTTTSSLCFNKINPCTEYGDKFCLGRPGIVSLELCVEEKISGVPKHVVSVMDISGSMSGQKIEMAKRGVIQTANVFTKLSREEAPETHKTFSLCTFNTSTNVLIEHRPLNAGCNDVVETEASRIRAEGGTDIEGAFIAAVELIKKNKGEPVSLQFYTDGEDSATSARVKTRGVDVPFIAELRAMKNVSVVMCAIGSDADINLFQNISHLIPRSTVAYCSGKNEDEFNATMGAMAGAVDAFVYENMSFKVTIEYSREHYAMEARIVSSGSKRSFDDDTGGVFTTVVPILAMNGQDSVVTVEIPPLTLVCAPSSSSSIKVTMEVELSDGTVVSSKTVVATPSMEGEELHLHPGCTASACNIVLRDMLEAVSVAIQANNKPNALKRVDEAMAEAKELSSRLSPTAPQAEVAALIAAIDAKKQSIEALDWSAGRELAEFSSQNIRAACGARSGSDVSAVGSRTQSRIISDMVDAFKANTRIESDSSVVMVE